MSALYENLIEVQGIDGTEDRGQVARLKESLTLTVEVAAALDATSDSDPATTGAPSEIAENMLAEFDSTVQTVIAALDLREMDTGDHSIRCADYAACIAETMGVAPAEIANIRRGVLMHDLGKLTIPNSVLRKPGKLTPEEWKVIRDHSLAGWKLIENVSILQDASLVTLQHHEAFWGGGHPGGMAGNEIYVGARIMAVVDAFDAITSKRSYKQAAPPSVAREKLPNEAGELLCPDTLEAFVASYDELCSVGNLKP